jgi:penicillin amidase
MSILRSALAGVVLTALLVLALHGWGPLPALGPLLDPWDGVWAAAATANLPARASASIPSLQDTVQVIYDDRAVPHVFARSEADAYRALGYVVARDRLFQLDVQTRAVAGRLTELVGRAALELDRGQRALGLTWSAERQWAAMDSTSEAARAMRAYADGVSAWIDGMSARDLPLEYRLLKGPRLRPLRWKPQYALYLMKRMGYTLAYNDVERTRARVAAVVGDAAADALFPIHSPIQEPIEPGPGPYPRFDFHPLPPPAPRSSIGEHGRARTSEAERGSARLSSSSLVHARPLADGGGGGEDAVGSNNWAVAPRRSATGHALLAGDPHLNLTLPSIWYEAHLVVHPPSSSSIALHRTGAGGGEGLDVYGVTIPAVPGIVIGFNRDVAWSFTNTESDVLDLYAEQLDDSAHPAQYRLDGAWRPLERRIERYVGPQGETLTVDTIYHTHRGPLVQRGDHPLSMRWTVLEADAGNALIETQHARSVDQWLQVMESFRMPAQNGVVADRSGTIAIRSTGAFPLRPGDGRGDVIRDGTTSGSDWVGFWPVTRYPFARNPRQGFLVSANQEPKDPRVDPGYLRSNWPTPWRAMRINQLLRFDSAVTVAAMQRYQTDPGSARADVLLGPILDLGTQALTGRTGFEAAQLKEAIELMLPWDRRYTRDNERAVLFELVVQELQDRLWDELGTPPSDGRGRIATPGEGVLVEALRDPTSQWWDDRRTPKVVERERDIVAASLVAALARARREHGDPRRGGWRWDRIRHANIYHLLGIPAFSALDLPIQGGPSTLNPSSGSGRDGASWRMVVELGPEVRAWGVYPGGQSGNPASSRYLDRIPLWVGGELDTLRFPRAPDEIGAAHTLARLTLVPGRP